MDIESYKYLADLAAALELDGESRATLALAFANEIFASIDSYDGRKLRAQCSSLEKLTHGISDDEFTDQFFWILEQGLVKPNICGDHARVILSMWRRLSESRSYVIGLYDALSSLRLPRGINLYNLESFRTAAAATFRCSPDMNEKLRECLHETLCYVKPHIELFGHWVDVYKDFEAIALSGDSRPLTDLTPGTSTPEGIAPSKAGKRRQSTDTKESAEPERQPSRKIRRRRTVFAATLVVLTTAILALLLPKILKPPTSAGPRIEQVLQDEAAYSQRKPVAKLLDSEELPADPSIGRIQESPEISTDSQQPVPEEPIETQLTSGQRPLDSQPEPTDRTEDSEPLLTEASVGLPRESRRISSDSEQLPPEKPVEPQQPSAQKPPDSQPKLVNQALAPEHVSENVPADQSQQTLQIPSDSQQHLPSDSADTPEKPPVSSVESHQKVTDLNRTGAKAENLYDFGTQMYTQGVTPIRSRALSAKQNYEKMLARCDVKKIKEYCPETWKAAESIKTKAAERWEAGRLALRIGEFNMASKAWEETESLYMKAQQTVKDAPEEVEKRINDLLRRERFAQALEQIVQSLLPAYESLGELCLWKDVQAYVQSCSDKYPQLRRVGTMRLPEFRKRLSKRVADQAGWQRTIAEVDALGTNDKLEIIDAKIQILRDYMTKNLFSYFYPIAQEQLRELRDYRARLQRRSKK